MPTRETGPTEDSRFSTKLREDRNKKGKVITCEKSC